MKNSIQKFLQALGDADQQVLQQCLQHAKHPLPEDAMPWYLGGAQSPAGYLTPAHAKIILSIRKDWATVPHGLTWDTPAKTHASRSLALAGLAAELRDLGHITGWRDEKFSFWPDSEILVNGQCIEPTDKLNAAFEMERAAYRFFGLRSQAVHVNGFTEDGFLWCGRRPLTKPTDPGMLDNIAAGGLPVGESLQLCGVREMAEEAGLSEALALTAVANGQVTTCRSVARGWHHETLWVYNLVVPADVQPVNQDGEVAEFTLLSPQQVVQAIAAKTMTVDASCVIAHAVLHASL
ncbi:MAG: NUDIX domain-containing protein [Betaproteobacteria bacterium]|nr:NUDIX domain-containing protein [Betaproteobacteria bacterium]